MAWLLTLILMLSGCHFGEPPAVAHPGCFETHIRDFLAQNRVRQPLYSDASNGQSESVSNILVLGETLSLWLARSYDRRARPFVDAGIPLLCDDFESVSNVPAFTGHVTPPSTFKAVARPKTKTWAKEIKKFATQQEFVKVSSLAQKDLDALSASPAYYCLLRHFLESIRRSANLAPRYIEQAGKLELDSKEVARISTGYIKSLARGLSLVAALDRKAAPLQEKGLPILCNDLPAVPAFPVHR